MNLEEFLKYISGIKPDTHFGGDRRGSEENVKIKFVIPLLQYLGYDLREDMDFEPLNLDIRLSAGKPTLVVECKGWDALITDHLNQCLEYTFKSRIPYVLITSGQHTALYSSLINPSDLQNIKPIIEFSFKDLLSDKGQDILTRFYELVSKDSFLSGAKQLKEDIKSRLPKGKTLESAMSEFRKQCAGFKASIKTRRITEEEFQQLAERHPMKVCASLITLRGEVHKIASEVKNMRIRYRSREIGLEYLLNAKPRPKIVGLFGVYPRDAHVAFGLEGWEELGVAKETMQLIGNPQKLPRKIKNQQDAEIIIRFLRGAVNEIIRK